MKKNYAHYFLLICSIFLLSIFNLAAQKYNIKGKLTDTLNDPLISATVLLLETDSTLIEFTQTALDGGFEFKKIEAGNYLVKTTYVGYIPITKGVKIVDKNIELATFRMSELATELMEVVIKAARAPIKMRGDTIEYDATTFKVPEGSTVEDLLRRLPGLDIESDGSLKSEGKDITRVTVDGKNFFGGDPKSATKNLPAEGVSKIQIFDKKTEEEKMTGQKSTSQEKEMNISLKDDFKKGGFGKVVVGGGNIERGEIKGNYNKFDTKNQFSLVGVANNTGRNGLSWDDYQDFMGSNSFNFDGGLEYGFNSGGGMRSVSFGSSGDDDNLEGKIQNIFFSDRNSGFPTSANGGANYNFDNEKTQISSSYFFNHSGNENETTASSSNFFNNFTTNTSRFATNENASNTHRMELKVTQKIDSLQTVVFSANLANANSDRLTNNRNSIFRNTNSLTSASNIGNNTLFGGSLIDVSGVLRKSFMKKGRFFGVNGSYGRTDVDEERFVNSKIDFYSSPNTIDSTQILNQSNMNIASKNTFKGNAMYSEPISKIFYGTVFYNISRRIQTGDIQVTDDLQDRKVQNDNLSRVYENDIFYQRAGATIKYNKDGVNVTLGGAYQEFLLRGDYSGKGSSTLKGTVNQHYNSFLPFVETSLAIGRSGNVSLTYSKSVREPSINSLLPIVDNRNPLFITEGNPNLLPTVSNDINVYASKSFGLSGFRIYVNGSMNVFENQTIQKETVDQNLITNSQPINFDGGRNLSTYTGINFPIYKNKIKGGINGSVSYNNSFAIVNELLNETNTLALRPSLSLNITPTQNFLLDIRYNFNNSNTTYNINTSQNQEIIRQGITASINTKLGKGVFFSSSYNHNFFKNERFGVNTNIPIINSSISKQFLKGNKGELRLSIYDLLNRNVQFNQFAGSNIVSQSSSTSLAQYGLLTFAYNIRGMKSELEQNNYD